MKIIFLFIPVSLMVTTHCFSQIVAQKKQAEQKKADTKTPTATINSAVRQSVTTKTSGTATNNSSGQNTNVKVDSLHATLANVYFSVVTAGSSTRDPGANKAAGTHWSCVLFDQNDQQVASFRDNNSSDEYVAGSETPALKMQGGNAAVFGDFFKSGRVHINIVPNGNDTWEISAFTLSLDFLNPKFTQKLAWNGIKLSQDKKDIDLFFYYEGNTSAPKYDIKANKESR